jgi:hypothetical protein
MFYITNNCFPPLGCSPAFYLIFIQTNDSANRFSENVAKFKYLETALADQNCMNEGIKSRLNSGNACHHSVQNLVSFRLLSRSIKVKIYKTIILPVVLYGCMKLGLSR